MYQNQGPRAQGFDTVKVSYGYGSVELGFNGVGLWPSEYGVREI